MPAVCGFGGMRDHGGSLSFAPRLPAALDRLAFRVCFAGRRLGIEVLHGQARYMLLDGEPFEITHHGEALTVAHGEPVSRPIPAAPDRPAPRQPKGRAPVRRRSSGRGPRPDQG